MKPEKSKYLLAFVCLFAIILFAATIEDEDKIIGTWKVGNGKAKVKIQKEGKKFFGRIVWMVSEKEADGTTKLDKNNPNEKMRKQPIMGLKLLQNFVYAGDNEWNDGTIYDPESGKTYSCKMTLTDQNTLEVRGFIGFSLLGRTDIWKREKE